MGVVWVWFGAWSTYHVCISESMDEVELEERLRAHSSHFSSMLELIPAKFYITQDESAAPGTGESKYWVNKRQKKTPKDIVKKAKRIKLDPETQKSVSELHAEALSREEESLESERGKDGRPQNGFSVDCVPSSSLSDLQQRLKEKIEGFRKTRKVPPEKGEGGASDKVTVKRHKKMQKLKREKELRKKKLVSGGGQSAIGGGGKMEGATRLTSGDEESKRVSFNRFDFSTPMETEVQMKKKTGKRDYKRLLAKAEATQRKLDELKKNDERRGRELEKKLRWQKALDMARGTKVKDDPKLLKKTSKRLEKGKQKSRKEWDDRKEFEREAKEKREEKRKKNIQQRRDQVKERKIKKRAKKGVKRKPGF